MRFGQKFCFNAKIILRMNNVPLPDNTITYKMVPTMPAVPSGSIWKKILICSGAALLGAAVAGCLFILYRRLKSNNAPVKTVRIDENPTVVMIPSETSATSGASATSATSETSGASTVSEAQETSETQVHQETSATQETSEESESETEEGSVRCNHPVGRGRCSNYAVVGMTSCTKHMQKIEK
jgi:hypothetical protein